MTTYNRPGVYINELLSSAAPISGIASATSAGAVIAAFAQGPDTVTRVTSWYDFEKKFGTYNKSYPASFSVGSFFKNGGTELYVKRVLPAAAKKVAKVNLPFASSVVGFTSGTLCTISAKHRGIDGNNIRVKVTSSKSVRDEGYFDISVYYEAGRPDILTGDVVTANGGDDLLVEQFNGVVFHDSLSGDYAPSVLEFSSNYIKILEGAVTEYDDNGDAIDPVVVYSVAKNSLYIPSSDLLALSGAPDPEVPLTYTDYTGDEVFDPTVVDSVTTATITGVYGNGTKVTYVSNSSFNIGSSITISGLLPTEYNASPAVSVTDTITSITSAIYAAKGDGTNITYQGGPALSVGDLVTTTGSNVTAYNVTNQPVVSVTAAVVDRVVSAVSGDGTNYEYTTTSGHGIVAGDLVTVTGASVSAYNVTNGVVVSTSGTTKFLVAGTTTTSATLTDGKVNRYAKFTVAGTASDTATVTSGAATRPAGFKVANTTTTTVTDASGTATRTINVADAYAIDDLELFKEFENIDRPLVFFLPDVTNKLGSWDASHWVYNALIDWVENANSGLKHFVVVETAPELSSVNLALQASGDLTRSSRAAVYYPHVFITDPVGRSGSSVRRIGPSGAVVGQYLSTDTRVGPFKSPAGIESRIVDAIALEKAFSPAELDALNSGVATDGTKDNRNVVNAIRNIPGAGIVIMGARTLLQDGTANRYVSMRRSLTYIQKRLNDIAQFAVFENNTEILWSRLRTVLGAFLNEYRNQGGLRGATIEESFYVKVDEENNTTQTISAGEVHIEIGVALEYPAEFVVINLSQKTAE
jgi:phage tail sheath protein FI